MMRVLVAATDSIVRAGLESILRASPDLLVVGVASDLDSVVALITAQSPDVVLMELGLQDEEPVSEKLVPLSTLTEVAIVLLGDTFQGDWITEALRLGVRAVLPRRATAEEILQAVVAAAAGLVVLHPDAIDLLLPVLSSVTQPVHEATLVQALTPREIEVLGMLAEGLGNKAIARRLSISEHTVKFHVSSIFTKLNARSRTEAVTLGARQGLIML
ncbi:MAG TPA: DNA-binding response regulator [Cyanobacteria bacterium UBA11049]|nr:DNA-binding response regulator [Cyanobacteria bacterium UBA11049]